MNLMTLFDKQLKENPHFSALSVSANNTTVTYSKLNDYVNNVAQQFLKQGIQKEDGVLVFIPMSLELYVTLLALFRIGAVAVFIDPQSSQEHIKSCIKKYPLKAFVGIQKAQLLKVKHRALREIPLQISVGYFPFTHNLTKWMEQNRETIIYNDVKKEDAALITFTSGSTGQPKAAVRTHEFLLKQYEILSQHMLFDKGVVDISTLPIFILANLATGMHSVIPQVNLLNPAKVNGQDLINDIIKYKAQRIGGSPTLIKSITPYLKEHLEEISLTHLYMGGGPVYHRDMVSIKNNMPKLNVIGIYGSTEAEPISHIDVLEYCAEKLQHTKKGNGICVGKPISEIQVKIIETEKYHTQLTSLSHIEVKIGEIIVSGEHVLKGYLHGEGNKENKIQIEGQIWHKTGDAGYFDDAGNLWLLGRYQQKIHYKNKTLYPFAVEAALYEKGIKSALTSYNNVPCLIVERNIDNALLKDLEIENLQIIKLPIPMDSRHNAKVDYKKLNLLLQEYFN